MAVALFFPSGIGNFWLVNLIWFIFKCIVVSIFTITIVRATRARMRLDQAFKFYLLLPTALALASLIFVLFSVGI
jgi:NADH-quinone oxidoreductase subunit H